MKVIITGTTGYVGEGVLLECLNNPEIEKVLSVSRRMGVFRRAWKSSGTCSPTTAPGPWS